MESPLRKETHAKLENKVFRNCLSKCAEKEHINYAGESIHHTIYQCMEHCGYKWQHLQTDPSSAL